MGGNMNNKRKTIFGIDPLKVLFAMEYVLQGLANPFQGITYQPFYKHFRFDYGMDEAATQNFFSRSYLAWSFKPIIGFLMDAFGKTKVIMIGLMILGSFIYFLTPMLDISALIFFTTMFILALVFACTDVAVDRATVLIGEEESRSSGRSKAATVGLNQSICWAAIYGTNIVAAFSGGWIADNMKIDYLMIALALVPLGVLLVVLRLPRDTSVSIPLRNSIANFWNGMNTGPIVWIILFYFLFHFQPAMGALWTNYLIEQLSFSQTQIGISDGISYFGFFLGVLAFASIGIKWQDRFGLKNVFKLFILGSVAINLTQYLLIDPTFSSITSTISSWMPGIDSVKIRLGYLSFYNFLSSFFASFIRMSTFSLVGAVIPTNAAGSLFAGFMSVANLAYSFSYSSGAWLYENGMNLGIFRFVQSHVFGLQAQASDKMSINLLIFIGSMAYLLSFLSVHMLPDKRQTRAADDSSEGMIGPQHFMTLGTEFLHRVNITSLACSLGLFVGLYIGCSLDLISSLILTFLIITFIRKVFLDRQYKKTQVQQH
jgi:MFS family permease